MSMGALHKYSPLDHLTFFSFFYAADPNSQSIRDRVHYCASATTIPHLDHDQEAVDVPVGIVHCGKKPDWRLILFVTSPAPPYPPPLSGLCPSIPLSAKVRTKCQGK